jgi:hypothetical protein
MTNSWFRVDKDGLRKTVERRGMFAIVAELIQNAWDSNADRVDVEVKKKVGQPLGTIRVTDTGGGFDDLTHAYTLFAESNKKDRADKRGRFNIGEKLVLAMCKSAVVRSTTGTVTFHEDGTMTHSKRECTKIGSEFFAELRMNADQFTEILEGLQTLLPPDACQTYVNGNRLFSRPPVCTFRVQLPTVLADEEGILRPTKRYTMVEVHEPKEGETAGIYEMGIPVVETSDRYHVNVMQKVPLTMERDNVPPPYLKLLRAEVLNHTVQLLTKDETSEAWVTNAMESPAIKDEAVVETLDKRFGKKRASFDPTDLEANMNLTSKGFTVLGGRTLPKAAWEQVRRAGAITSAGKLAPTPKPYSTDPDADPVDIIPLSEWTWGMREVEEISRWVAKQLSVNEDLPVTFVKPKSRPNYKWVACFGGGLDWNVTVLGKNWFDTWREHTAKLFDILIHEFAHKKAGNHLDENFHRECTRLGGELATLFLRGEKLPV